MKILWLSLLLSCFDLWIPKIIFYYDQWLLLVIVHSLRVFLFDWKILKGAVKGWYSFNFDLHLSSVFKGQSHIGQNMFLTFWSRFKTVKFTVFLWSSSHDSTEQSVLETYALSPIKGGAQKWPKAGQSILLIKEISFHVHVFVSAAIIISIIWESWGHVDYYFGKLLLFFLNSTLKKSIAFEEKCI